jgi:hypothetical protein
VPAADQEEIDFELCMVWIATNELDSTHTVGHGYHDAVRNAVGGVVATDANQLIISFKKIFAIIYSLLRSGNGLMLQCADIFTRHENVHHFCGIT